ncbi:MAG: hypothetical protein SOR95_10465 [Sutterella sp.]|nr:hypothetical protein [Sutterella sp.]
MTDSLIRPFRADRVHNLARRITSDDRHPSSLRMRPGIVRLGVVSLLGLSTLTGLAAESSMGTTATASPQGTTGTSTTPATVTAPAQASTPPTTAPQAQPTQIAPQATSSASRTVTPNATPNPGYAPATQPQAQGTYAQQPPVSSASRRAPQPTPNAPAWNGNAPAPTWQATPPATAPAQGQAAAPVDVTTSASRAQRVYTAPPAPANAGVNATSSATLMQPSTQVQTPPSATSGATVNHVNALPNLTLDEANAPRRLLERIGASSPIATPHFAYAQPKNKKAACKILISQVTEGRTDDFLWDGDCKGGYAKGLGRLFWSQGPLRLNAIVNVDDVVNDRLFAVLMIHNEKTDSTELNMTSYPTKPWDAKDPDRVRYETVSTRTTVERYDGKTSEIYHTTALLSDVFRLKTTLSQKSQTYLVREDINGVSYSAWQALNAKKDGVKGLEQLWYIASPTNPQTPLGVGMARLVDGTLMKIRFKEKGWEQVNVPDAYFEPFERMARTRAYMQQQTADFNKRGATLLADYLKGVCQKRVQPADTRSVSKADFFAICDTVPAFIEASKAITITDEEIAKREAERKAKGSDTKKK